MDWAMKTYGLSGDVGTFEGVLSKPYWDQVGGMTQKTGENIEFIHQSIGKEHHQVHVIHGKIGRGNPENSVCIRPSGVKKNIRMI